VYTVVLPGLQILIVTFPLDHTALPVFSKVTVKPVASP
jgi:hypothetical protein